ncbi:MAG: dethiobiotin synthase [Clostridium sp.]|nr:dethiobiotin synthase [Prevotella sp.]MCM1428277.1 dethiobiotin synthase [Clostridium sp.]
MEKLKYWPQTVFVSGIGTDIGKSYATGWLAKRLMDNGKNVITQKFIQTGCDTNSEDIEIHRQIMGIPPQTVDLTHITAPEIFTYPASPDLAARIDGREVNLNIIDEATATLQKSYDHVLIEGAGGLMVPLKGEYLTIDYIRERKLPTVLVTNGRLGSISDTLLSLSAILHAGIELTAVVWNPHFDKDKIIANDSKEYISKWLETHFPKSHLIEMGCSTKKAT